ncbi:hypothetical protein A9Q84_04565 [Halobacteriovorax marinus]|uniref:Uncharacterized protein n=1 Tax=Halobacteriovorax marinus TaxID=97084 RepID=A0A1Y5FAQ2_9BACT|nr:hypothetical protein A9Q84_04565 [Halobacteriovorax marinus]
MILLNFIEQHSFFALSVVFLNLIILLIIYKAKKFKSENLRSVLYIPARKSKTDAVVLGGLALSISNLYVIQFFYSAGILGTFEKFSCLGYLLASFLVTIHGYLDDKFEIAPKVKLLSQLFAVITFSMFFVFVLPTKFIFIYIPIAIFWGFGTLNGSNLLDGLDTMSVKVSSIVFLTFCSIAYLYNIKIVLTLVPFFWCAILCFYVFNRAPAKIHLGEIGPNLLGTSYIFFSSLIYINSFNRVGNFNALILSILPLSIPMSELGVSFLRRLYFKKSPFKSDRLHLHHILTRERKYSSSKASTLAALTFLIPSIVAMIFLKSNPVLAYLLHGISIVLIYILTCFKFWKRDQILEQQESLKMGKALESKNIKLINSSMVDEFDIEVDDNEDGN